MATRATLTFNSNNEGTVHVYNHWDGYPEGIAEKLAAFMAMRTSGIAASYLRANHDGELTPHAKAHSDRQFHYEIGAKGNGEIHISAYEIPIGSETLSQIFAGTITDFLNRYGDHMDWATVVPDIGRPVQGRAKDIQARITQSLDHAQHWLSLGLTGNANACLSEAKHVIRAAQQQPGLCAIYTDDQVATLDSIMARIASPSATA